MTNGFTRLCWLVSLHRHVPRPPPRQLWTADVPAWTTQTTFSAGYGPCLRKILQSLLSVILENRAKQMKTFRFCFTHFLLGLKMHENLSRELPDTVALRNYSYANFVHFGLCLSEVWPMSPFGPSLVVWEVSNAVASIKQDFCLLYTRHKHGGGYIRHGSTTNCVLQVVYKIAKTKVKSRIGSRDS